MSSYGAEYTLVVRRLTASWLMMAGLRVRGMGVYFIVGLGLVVGLSHVERRGDAFGVGMLYKMTAG